MEKQKKEPLATEIICDMQDRIDNIMLDIEGMDEDLERTKFVLNELLELVMDEPKDEKEALRFANNQNRIYMLADVALDYIARVRSDMTDLIIRVRKDEEDAEEETEGGEDD